MGSGPCRCRQSNEGGFCPPGPTQPIPLVLVINIALRSLPLSPSSRWSVSSAKVGQSVNSTLPAMEIAPEMEEANSGKSQVLGEKKNHLFSCGCCICDGPERTGRCLAFRRTSLATY